MTTIAAAAANRNWGFGHCDVIGRTGDFVGAIISLNGNKTTLIHEVVSMINGCKANVEAVSGCRLKRVSGSQILVTASADQIGLISNRVQAEFNAAPPEFPREVEKIVANHDLSLFVRKDKPGVLASIVTVVAKFRGSVVTMAASTGEGIETQWGRSSMKLHFPSDVDIDVVWDPIERLAVANGWDIVLKRRSDGREYSVRS